MKIEHHDISMKTQSSFSQTTAAKYGEEWNASLTEGLQAQKTEASDSCDLAKMVDKLRCELIHELLGALGAKTQDGQSEVPAAMSNEVAMSKDMELEFKRLNIPVKRVTYTEEQQICESVSAKMQGCVRTSDGREIALDVNLKMSQSFYSKVEKSQAVFTDPLVVNFDGKLPELENASFSFDIDSDGESDQISKLSSGSGFLALDKNGNGTIDDGSELFGTTSGDGFADLAKYDEDGNGWIDEGDSVFDKLRVWTGSGEDGKLLALGETGIGAIYLGSAASDFTYRSPVGQTLGALRSTGMFLYENGKTGNISQIDFTKQNATEGDTLSSVLQTV